MHSVPGLEYVLCNGAYKQISKVVTIKMKQTRDTCGEGHTVKLYVHTNSMHIYEDPNKSLHYFLNMANVLLSNQQSVHNEVEATKVMLGIEPIQLN